MHLGAGSSGGKGKPGRSLSYATKIQFNGNLMVGKAYTAQVGLKPDDEFEIKLGRKQIQLIPLGAAEEESGTTGIERLRQNSQQFCLTPPAPVPPIPSVRPPDPPAARGHASGPVANCLWWCLGLQPAGIAAGSPCPATPALSAHPSPRPKERELLQETAVANDAKKAAAPLDDWLRQNYFNDGVRLNIRPFLNATLRKGGREGAGILRWKPFDIKTKADRGNEPNAL